MKVTLSLLAGLVSCASLAQPQTATVTAYCRSLALTSVIANNGVAYNFDLTTATNSTGLPFYVPEPDNTYLVSNELRPLAGQKGVYEADYLLLLTGVLAQYGYLTLAIPTLDTNRDGIPDLLDPSLPSYSAVTGNGTSTWPSASPFQMSLRLSRPAGATNGSFSGIWSTAGGSFIMNGTLQLVLLQGTATYTRVFQNQLELQLTRQRVDGTTTTLTGAVVYAASANLVSLPRFNLMDDTGQSYTVLPTSLTRHGDRYQGKLKFVDGAPETPWPDYTDWILSITDPNDSNTNGIPDLSDPAALQIPTAMLTVTNNGPGTVSPALSGEELELDKTYRLTAKPAVGYLFGGWSGDLTSASPTLSFLLQSNLNLTANFVPNPFYPVRGNYYGLVQGTNGAANQTLGSISAAITQNGAFSARIRLGGKSFSVSGTLDQTGTAFPAYAPANQEPVFLGLHLDLAGGTGLTGTISNEVWSAGLEANRAPFNPVSNPCPYQGGYTLVVPYTLLTNSGPQADGYGALRVTAAGRLQCYGSLPDGTPVTQSTMVSAAGDWPLYASLYAGAGCVSAWANLTNHALDPGAGLLTWLKPAIPRARYYPEGFTNQVLLGLSAYSPPTRDLPLFDWTNGFAIFSGGNLGGTVIDALSLENGSKLVSPATNRLSVHVLANGMFRGTVRPPGSNRAYAFGGAVLPPSGWGLGYLLGTNQSALVELAPLVPPSQPNPTPPLAQPPPLPTPPGP